MKAIVFKKYGSPEDLKFEEINKPIPKENEVLVKILAASINSWDMELLKGEPFANRAMFGLLRPKVKTLGADIAGKVEGIGKNVNKFSKGDKVFGDLSQQGWGGFAEYVCVDENVLTLKSEKMTYNEAAALPQAGALAFRGLTDFGKILPGQKVLINGAGGGVGTFAIQLAKSFGAAVTAIDSEEKLAMMTSIGADHVIDYATDDFAKNGQQYDYILDNVATRSIFSINRALNCKGRYVIIGGTSILQFVILGSLFALRGKQMKLLIHNTQPEDIDELIKLFEDGTIKPVIEKSYKLAEVPEALHYFSGGHAKGKLLIEIDD